MIMSDPLIYCHCLKRHCIEQLLEKSRRSLIDLPSLLGFGTFAVSRKWAHWDVPYSAALKLLLKLDTADCKVITEATSTHQENKSPHTMGAASIELLLDKQ